MATTDRAEYVPEALVLVESEIRRRGLNNVTSARHLELKREREQAEERARPRPIRWLAWVFPETSSGASALRVARQGAIASWVVGTSTFLLALFATRVDLAASLKNGPGTFLGAEHGFYVLLGAVLYVGLGFGVWAGSLIAAAAALILYVGAQAYVYSAQGSVPNGVVFLLSIAFWNGVRGAKALRGFSSTVVLSPSQPSQPSERTASASDARDLRVETNRRDIIMEVCLVILLTMGYSMLQVVVGFVGTTSHPSESGGLNALWQPLHELSYIALLLYLIHRGSLPRSRFGLLRPAWQDFPLGIGVWAFEFSCIRHHWTSALTTAIADVSHTHWSDVATLPVLLLSAFYQELLMRGYFITRFEQLFESQPLSILAAAVLFSFWHAYQGPSGVSGSLISGLIYGAVFVKTRRLTPLVLGHALWNFVGRT